MHSTRQCCGLPGQPAVVWPAGYRLTSHPAPCCSVHVWEDPGSFRPERWLAKDAAYSGSGARRFLPFSDGIKNCLGQVSRPASSQWPS
jgi:hypothetical protein